MRNALLALAFVGACFDGRVPGDAGASSRDASVRDDSGSTNPDDAGASSDLDASLAADADEMDAFATPSVCTSGTRWTRGDHGSGQMHPGVACIDCHSSERDAPSFALAGTVYPTGHEPNDCNGTSRGVRVIITDVHGSETTLTPNAAGNFYVSRSIAFPYRARIERDGNVREMDGEQTDGDCNSCHTESGDNDAPGRIMAP